MAQGVVKKKGGANTKPQHAKKKQAGVTKRGQRVKATKKAKNEKQRQTEKLTKIINKSIEAEMVQKAENDRKGLLGVVKPGQSKDVNLIKYRKDLKKKGVGRK